MEYTVAALCPKRAKSLDQMNGILADTTHLIGGQPTVNTDMHVVIVWRMREEPQIGQPVIWLV